jgi:hypothetical protein
MHGFPYAYYTPETDWAFGGSAIVTFRPGGKPALNPSSLTRDSYYTIKKQFKCSIEPEIYFSGNRYLLSGSFGAGIHNDVPAMAERFASRINFVHLRNVARNAEGDFVEEDHLEGDVDMFAVMRTLLREQKRREDEGRKDLRIPMRPDHGHLMLSDEHRMDIYPGYSLFGRMRGLAEIRGLELGIRRTLGL